MRLTSKQNEAQIYIDFQFILSGGGLGLPRHLNLYYYMKVLCTYQVPCTYNILFRFRFLYRLTIRNGGVGCKGNSRVVEKSSLRIANMNSKGLSDCEINLMKGVDRWCWGGEGVSVDRCGQ